MKGAYIFLIRKYNNTLGIFLMYINTVLKLNI